MMISMLDMMLCIFVSLNSAHNGEFSNTDFKSNLSVSCVLIGLIACFAAIVVAYGGWRYKRVIEAEEPFDVPVSGYLSNLYEGVCTTHPVRNVILHSVFMARKISYAAIIVYLYEEPVF
jgi:hypothetical protein